MKDVLEMFGYIKEKVEQMDAKLENVPTREEIREIVRTEVGRVESKLGAFENHEVDKRKQLEVRVGKLEQKVFR